MIASGSKSSCDEVAPHRCCQRVDIDRIVVIAAAPRAPPAASASSSARETPGRRRSPSSPRRTADRAAPAGCGRSPAPSALWMRLSVDRVGVAHGPVDDRSRSDRPARAASFSACARVIVFSGPSSRSLFQIVCVVLALAAGAHRQDDQVEDRPPLPARHLDDALVGQELLEVAAHRPVVGAVGRAEVEQQHAERGRAPRPDGRLASLFGYVQRTMIWQCCSFGVPESKRCRDLSGSFAPLRRGGGGRFGRNSRCISRCRGGFGCRRYGASR